MDKIPVGTVTVLACPECGPDARLVVRAVKRTGKQFLGCQNYPDCTYTKPIPESLVMQYSGHPRLL